MTNPGQGYDILLVTRLNAVQLSSLLEATSFIEVGTAAAKTIGINMVRSLDVVVRDVTVGGTNVQRVRGVTARTSLTAAGHRLDYGFITDLIARARAWNIPCGEDGNYATVISPYVTPELAALPQWQAVESYMGQDSGIYVGECGRIHGLTFVESYNSKLFLGGGATAQTASTLNGAVNAGATAIAYAANAGKLIAPFSMN